MPLSSGDSGGSHRIYIGWQHLGEAVNLSDPSYFAEDEGEDEAFMIPPSQMASSPHLFNHGTVMSL